MEQKPTQEESMANILEAVGEAEVIVKEQVVDNTTDESDKPKEVTPVTDEGKEDTKVVSNGTEPVKKEQTDKDSEAKQEDPDKDTDAKDLEKPEEGEKSTQPEGKTKDFDILEFFNDNPKEEIVIGKDSEGEPITLTAKVAFEHIKAGSSVHEKSRKLDADRSDFEESRDRTHKEISTLHVAMMDNVNPQMSKSMETLTNISDNRKYYEAALASDRITPQQRIDFERKLQEEGVIGQENYAYIIKQRGINDQYQKLQAERVEKHKKQSVKGFEDPWLKNTSNRKHLFNDVKEIIGENDSKFEILPGQTILDLMETNEELSLLLKDGIASRKIAKAKPAGNPTSAKQNYSKKPGADSGQQSRDEELEQRAKGGDADASQQRLDAVFKDL